MKGKKQEQKGNKKKNIVTLKGVRFFPCVSNGIRNETGNSFGGHQSVRETRGSEVCRHLQTQCITAETCCGFVFISLLPFLVVQRSLIAV